MLSCGGRRCGAEPDNLANAALHARASAAREV